ncbi:MAG: UbiD family decarboxylase, partial [Hyphomicrobiales bacterium]|nr:UbiD family decarboxylase [Hyphomicrobiales bacterium]
MGLRTLPKFRDAESYLAWLEARGELVRISTPVSVHLEMTEIHRRVIAEGGPALLFEKPLQADGSASGISVLVNLFGTVSRVAWGLGIEPEALETLGDFFAELRAPTAPRSLKDVTERLPLARAALSMRPKTVNSAAAQEMV